MWIVNVLVGTFNQENALVGAFSVIVKSLQTFVFISTNEPRSRCVIVDIIILLIVIAPIVRPR